MIKTILRPLVLGYLCCLARLQLKKNSRAILIGITGSAGKTSTRRAVALVLRSKGKVKESLRANSESGIPLNILGLQPRNYSILDWLRLLLLAPLALFFNWEHYDYYVVEMGIDSPEPPKNMASLLRILHPHVAVILNAGLVHTAAFDHLVKDRHPLRRARILRQLVAQEKMRLAQALPPTGIAIVNRDQVELTQLTSSLRARLLTIGSHRSAQLRFSRPRLSRRGFSLRFHYQGQDFVLALPDLYESSYAYTFAAAVAVGASLGVAPKKSLRRLSRYHSPPGRLRVFPGIHSSTLIDSSYNASPQTMQSTLQLLSRLAGKRPKLAVLGDMRELGRQSKSAHKQLAAWIQEYANAAVLFGQETRRYTLPILQAAKFPVRHFHSMAVLITYLHSHLPPHSWVLIKGSQNTIFLERAVAALLQKKSDIHQLCRRGPYWEHIRASFD